MYREIQYGAWHVVFREDLAEEVTSERIKFKKQLTNKEKGENIKTFIQSEFDIFKNRKKKKKTRKVSQNLSNSATYSSDLPWLYVTQMKLLKYGKVQIYTGVLAVAYLFS